MDNEVTPVLGEVEGINLDRLQKQPDSEIRKFEHKRPAFQDMLGSSAKIPKFLLPTIREQLKAGGPVNRSALVIAAWCRYSEGFDEAGKKYPVEDDMKVILQEKALLSHKDHLAFLKIESIFGDLINSGRFTETYIDALLGLYNKGVINSIKDINVK